MSGAGSEGDLEVLELVARLEQAGVQLSLSEGRLSFRAPKGVLTARLREALAASKSEIIDFLQRRGGEVRAPVAFGQEGLWLLNQLALDSALYNLGHAVRLRGELDTGALHRALRKVVDRHPSLRTRFENQETGLVQVVDPAPEVELPCQEIAESALEPALAAALSTPFNLERDVPVRFDLLRLGETDHVLVAVAHHIACDAWSMDVLVGDAAAFYASELSGQPAALPALTTTYADFAVQQRGLRSNPVWARSSAYWRAEVRGAERLDFPNARARHARPTYRGARHRVLVDSRTRRKLEELSTYLGATLFMTLLSSFQLGLGLWCDQADVSVATPLSLRNRSGLEGLVGYFVDTVPIRANLAAEQGFDRVVAEARGKVLGAFARRDVPYGGAIAGADAAPQAFFALQGGASNPLELPGLEAQALSVDSDTSKFDLTLSLRESEGGLEATFEYATDLFDAETVSRFASHWTRILEQVAEDPARPISSLELMDRDERALVVEHWNATDTYFEPGLVQDLIAAKCRETPEAIALSFAGASTTYGELAVRSDRLAALLQEHGVGPEVIVGICLERSVEMVVAVLAVLKAGGAYLPLDPAYPAERLAFMLEDCAASVLVTRSALLGSLPEHQAKVLDIDALPQAVSDRPARASLSPENLAYVTYTSGSTGRPKGVMTRHAGVSNYVRALIVRHELGRTDRVLNITSLGFDASVRDLTVPLIVGGCVVLLDGDSARDPSAMADAISRERITAILSVVPSLLDEICRESSDQPNTTLRLILTSGEALQGATVALAKRTFAAVEVINQYGSTETTMTSTYFGAGGAPAGLVALIGRPIANMRIYILDGRLEPTPPGTPGDLYVAGPGMSRGYLGKPGLTARMFSPCPFGAPGERMYSSGDRAVWTEDGKLEFLGRRDNQIKIRGQRVELGEIEALLRDHHDVVEAVVSAWPNGSDVSLAAYVRTSAPDLDLQALARGLGRRLPMHMVPRTIQRLETFPRTPNGKIDRSELPRPVLGRGLQIVRPATTPLEMEVAQAASQVLGLTEVGMEHNFFALGGHSLLATRLVAIIRNRTGREAPLRFLFEAADFGELCKLLTETAVANGAPPAAGPRPDRVPLSLNQERLWFLEQLGLSGAAYNVGGGLALHGPLDPAAIRWALAEVVGRHESLRTRFESVGGAGRQIIQSASALEVSYSDLGGLSPEESARELERLRGGEEEARFNLRTEDPIRARLVRQSEFDHVLLVTIHHLVCDAWSMSLLTRDVAEMYASRVEGRASVLPDLTVQYADFALWQRDRMSGPTMDAHLNYWRGQLAGAPPLLHLPTDRRRPETASPRGAHVRNRLRPALIRRLTDLGRRNDATLYMVLLAGFGVALGRWSGQDEMLIGSAVAGRSHSELEPLVGFFVNNVVLRADLQGDPHFEELLGRVRIVTLGAFAHQDCPFDKVVAEIAPERDLSRQPLCQVAITLQNVPELQLEAAGLTAQLVPPSRVTSKFDLTLSLRESEGGLEATFEYATDLFDAETVSRFASHWTRILEQVAEDPARPISSLELMDRDERALVVEHWNATDTYFEPGLVQDLIAAKCRETPEAIALSFAGASTTYGELAVRSDRLAALLQEHGVGPEVIVGICLERSVEMVVAVLAVLKAGGAYLPLDPAYPAERLAFMLEDCAASVLVTRSALLGSLPEHQAKVLDMDALPQAVSDRPARASLSPENLAYVTYTSGSTGRPKGVMTRHAGLQNLVCAQIAAFEIAPASRVLQFASLSFDASVSEIMTALAAGARLCLADRRALMPGADLQNILREEAISVVTLPPAALPHLDPHDLPALRTLALAGEAASLEAVAAWRDGCRLINAYGPTENAVCSTWGRRLPGEDSFPIGRPLANTSAYVLDVGLEPCPIGVAGELYVSGVGLARGYLGRPGLTSSRFVADPFGPAGTRMYRTGDRARWRSDGELEFLGRVDDQVKIRGFRIEPGEIEARLLSHVGVREAAVIAREDRPGEKRLVAYVAPDLAALRSSQEADAEAVAQWETLYDDTYEQMGEGPSFVGWNSSYTGEPIPEPEMAHWLSSTLERITALQPRRVLEVGCGAGLFLQHLAPGCETYVATDVSGQVVAELKRWIGGRPELSHVELMRREARDFAGIESGDFDTVVLNSVIQYFPGVDYLLEVLQGAVARVGSGGKVFVGDVRHLGLLGAFQAAVQLSRASPEADAAQLWALAERARAEEQELLVDPGFFLALKARWPQIGAVEILLKRGEADNELTRHRYDVVLHVGPVAEVPTADGLELEGEDIDLERLADLLKREQPPVVWLRGLVNRRLASDLAAWRALRDARPGDLAQQAADVCARADEGVEPETFWALAEAHGYQAHIGYDPRSGGERFDVRLTHQTVTLDLKTLSGPAPDTAEPWGRYANAPQDVGLKIKLAADLREHMRQVLPEHMIPQALVLLEALPLNTNGKLDRRALPQPEGRPPGLAYVAPRTPTEKTLAAIWQDVLGLDRVGANDNFFELGGHSLLAIQIASKIQTLCGVDLALRTAFEAPVLSALALATDAAIQARDQALAHRAAALETHLRTETATLSDADVERMLLDLEQQP